MATPSTARCTVCSNLFNDPRMLPCLHTFCLQCIKKESELQGAKGALKCPMRGCGETVALPKGGLVKLPSDQRKVYDAELALCEEKLESGKQVCDGCVRKEGPAIAFCVNCCEFLCKLCETHHRSARKTQKHEIVGVVDEKLKKSNESCNLERAFSNPLVPCPNHPDEVLKFYCEKCEELICRDCRDVNHDSHRSECRLVDNVAARAMESLRGCAKDSPKAVDALKGAILKCELVIARVESQKNEVDDMICKSLNEVREALLTRNEELQKKKTTSLQLQIEALKKVGDDLEYAQKLIDSATSYTPAQQLATKRVIAERVEELMKRYHDSNCIPLESTHFLTKVGDQGIIREMIHLGQISSGSDAVSGTCDIGFVPRAVVGKARTIKVTARNEGGKPFPYGKETVEVKLSKMESNELSVHSETTDHGDGTYSVSFTAQSPGLYEAQVTIGGHPIKSSPFTLTVRQPRTTPYDTLSPQRVFSTYSNPWDLAFTDDGTMAVVEYGSHTVSLFSVDGTRLHTFGTSGSPGSGDKQFNYPTGVAIRGDEMYVTDGNNNRVQKIRISDRTHIGKFGSSGKGDNQFSNPRGICIHPDGRLFIADYSNHRIQVHQPDGTFVSSITQNEESKFQSPWGLAFNPQGLLHIAAYSSHCIKVYTPEGDYVESYGSGTVNKPVGIAIDEEGYIAVSEYSSNGIWIYNPDHTQLANTIQCSLSNPTGITCDAKGIFWVAESGNNRVHKF